MEHDQLDRRDSLLQKAAILDELAATESNSFMKDRLMQDAILLRSLAAQESSSESGGEDTPLQQPEVQSVQSVASAQAIGDAANERRQGERRARAIERRSDDRRTYRERDRRGGADRRTLSPYSEFFTPAFAATYSGPERRMTERRFIADRRATSERRTSQG